MEVTNKTNEVTNTTTEKKHDNIFRIYEGNMNRLEKKLTRIRNKCNKYGCDFTYKKIGEEYTTIENKLGEKEVIKQIVIHVNGKAIVNDWEFVATLEHTSDGNIINGYAEDVEVPERYYDAEPVCEHCKTNRRRKDTYIIRNINTNEFKQVGRSCLKDFTHGFDAAGVAAYMSMFSELIEGEAPYEGSHHETYYNLKRYLMHCKEWCNKFGYRKSQEPDATYDMAWLSMMVEENRKPYMWSDKEVYAWRKKLADMNYNYKKNEQFVDDALVWVRTQEKDNNYMNNLKVVCSSDYVNAKHLGLACSLMTAYDKELAYQAELRIRAERRKREMELEQKSDYIGEIGERISVDVADARLLTSWETQWGYTYMYKFKDKEGNVFIWKASKWIGNDEDEIIVKTLKGTVKQHSEFKDVKQTVLTRCKVA